MKYSFSFMQIVNWLLLCRQNLATFNADLKRSETNREEIINKLKAEKRKLLLVKDVLDRKVKFQGINADFLKNFKQIKKDYGVED